MTELVARSINLLLKTAIGAGFGLLAALINYYLFFSLYGNITIHLGEIVAIVCMVKFGLRAGIVASLISTLGLYFAIGNLNYFVLFAFEIVFLYLLVKRGTQLLIADFLFWLFIGLPLTFLIVYFIAGIKGDFLFIVLFKHVVNGILVAAIASIILSFWRSNPDSIDSAIKPKLATQIFSLSIVSITTPSLIVAMILTTNAAEKLERQIELQLVDKARYMANLISNYVMLHQQAVSNVAQLYSLLPDDELANQNLLEQHKTSLPGFISMIVTDKEGNVIQGSPQDIFDANIKSLNKQQNVSDRDYFLRVQESKSNYVSQVFKGRGFGQDPIIALSSPILKNQQFTGIVEGSLNLPNFYDLEEQAYAQDELMLVSDRNNNIIFASAALEQETLTQLIIKKPAMLLSNQISIIELSEKAYLYADWETKEGWTIFVLKKPDIIFRSLSQNVILVSVSLIFLILLFLAVARQFASQITKPLELLVEQFSGNKIMKSASISNISSKEISLLFKSLSEAKRISVEFQKRLSEEVKIKTSQLTLMNNQLKQLATLDGLTQLLNRRSFDEKAVKLLKASTRNQLPLTFAIVDIDDFKRINDSFGHPAGDYCIKFVATQLADIFKRDTDLVSRYGGEEFALILGDGSPVSHKTLLLDFVKRIAESQIVFEQMTISLTVSLGAFTVQNGNKIEYTQLVKNADRLLYQAKDSGRNKAVFGDDS
ncbi:diguanylate cyclase [Aliiglaciecola lipolytica]|uniref:diguanylate cyclase n=1 Tax=Aliiglaciecola lipolytica E3 TaxID=1127673 RepID=K6X6Y1_9ALTE|nr:diguanylate cyclase [Aliiglaciecola lipolytica]GAC16349.1 hypothetical protein GLIP_3738 [Aliiglaciecola lipolytica E3]